MATDGDETPTGFGSFDFDPQKDHVNQDKHGISLNAAAELEPLAYVDDLRFEEPRFRVYGTIDGLAYCVAGMRRDGRVRVISLRRAHAKEMRRYVERGTGPE